jgi:hypothetical protein
MWDVQQRQVVVAGERGGHKFEELLCAPGQLYRSSVTGLLSQPHPRLSAITVASGRAFVAPSWRLHMERSSRHSETQSP